MQTAVWKNIHWVLRNKPKYGVFFGNLNLYIIFADISGFGKYFQNRFWAQAGHFEHHEAYKLNKMFFELQRIDI